MGQIKNIKLHIVTDIKQLIKAVIYIMAGVAAKRWVHNVTRIYRTVRPTVMQNLALARSELAPPGVSGLVADLKAVNLEAVKSLNPLNMTFNQAGGKALVLLEIYLWFKVGEVLGRGSFVGYQFSDEERFAIFPKKE